MKAVILPGIASQNHWRQGVPNLLMPVVNKPMAEHWIENCVRHGIKEIVLVIDDWSDAVCSYFGSGERWGAHLIYHEAPHLPLGKLLLSLKPILDETTLFVYEDVYTSVHLGRFRFAHQWVKSSCTFFRPGTDRDVLTRVSPVELLAPLQEICFILNRSVMDTLNTSSLPENLHDLIQTLQRTKQLSFSFNGPAPFRRIRSFEEYWQFCKALLMGHFPEIIMPGKQISKGIWVGNNTSLPDRLDLAPPVLIGQNCIIHKDTRLGPLAILGNRLVIGKGAYIRESVIMDHTYVGPFTDIVHCIANKDSLFNWKRNSTTTVPDAFILGQVPEVSLFKKEALWLGKNI